MEQMPGADVGDFTLSCPRDLLFMPKVLALPEKPDGALASWKPSLPMAAAATYASQLMAENGKTLNTSIADYFWAFQHAAPANALIPIKPIVGLQAAIEVPPKKALFISKAV